MASPRRQLAAFGLALLAAAIGLLAEPSPPAARANVPCAAVGAVEAVTGGVGAITGGMIGGGNPLGDACDKLTNGALGALGDQAKGALEGIGNDIFNQVTTWVSEGAAWLIGQVASAIDKTTTPKLTSEGFLAEYGQMAEIAAVLAAAMVLLAVLEAVAQGSWALLARTVLVNLPVAFIATSAAFAVVQVLLVATDGMCHAVAVATQEHSERFFRSAIGSLAKAGGDAGADGSSGDPTKQAVGAVGGAVAVPLFVTFLAAIVGGFGAFFIWIEMLARDASVYAVALFMPIALAASIWPRWTGVLRRTGELLVTVIGSKFVIVSIIALAASLVAEKKGGVEPLLAASALMLLACFAPFLLLRLAPFAEGAMAAAYGRRSASGASLSGLQIASDVAIVRNMARSNWSGGPPEVWSVSNGGAQGGGGRGTGSPAGGPRGGGGSGSTGAGRAGARSAGAEAPAAAGTASMAGAAPVSAAASAPAAAGQGARRGAERLATSAAPKAASAGTRAGNEQSSSSAGAGHVEPSAEKPAGPAEQPPRPPQELPSESKARSGE